LRERSAVSGLKPEEALSMQLELGSGEILW